MDSTKTKTTHRTFQVLWALAHKGGTGVGAQEIHDLLRGHGATIPVKDIRQTLSRLAKLKFAWSSGAGFTLTGMGQRAAFLVQGLDPFADDFKTHWAESLVVKAVKGGGERSAADVAETLGLSQTATCSALKAAAEAGKVRAVGRGKSARYAEAVPPIPFSPNDQDLSDIATMDFRPRGVAPANFPVEAVVVLAPDDWKLLRTLAGLAKTPENELLTALVKEGLERWKEDALKALSRTSKSPLKERKSR